MKKVLTIVLVAILTIVGQAAMAQGNSNARSKRPDFVNEKHRAHAEWKQEKAHGKKHKKHKKHKDHENCDHDDDRYGDRDRRDRDDDDRRDYPWEKTAEQRRTEGQRRTEEQNRNPRTVRDVILRRTGGN